MTGFNGTLNDKKMVDIKDCFRYSSRKIYTSTNRVVIFYEKYADNEQKQGKKKFDRFLNFFLDKKPL